MSKFLTLPMLLLGLLFSLSASAKEKVLIDTDSAYFNDDGAAIAALLRYRDKFEILGITVVAGNEWPLQGAEYLLKVLELFHANDVPLYLGEAKPLLNSKSRIDRMTREWGGVEWIAAFAKKPPLTRKDLEPPFGGKFASLRPKSQHAVDFLIQSIEKNPGEVTVLALGPMTNLARAFRKKPSLAGKIRRLVFMGGNVGVPGNSTAFAETNFFFDPEAASEVLRSNIPEKIMLGLDLTNQAPFDKALFDRVVKKRTPLTEIIEEDLGRRYPGFLKTPTAHTYLWDTLVALYLIDSSVVRSSEEMYVDVITQFGPAYGGVLAYPTTLKAGRYIRRVRVLRGLDRQKSYDMFVDLMTRPL